jgi:PhzF family phenazine biosynthesis protein
MDFPSEPARPCPAPPGLIEAIGVKPRFVGDNRMHFLVELESESQVRSLAPDFRAIARLPRRGVIATARSSAAQFDFVSRYFAPAVGIDEDPVTGSAHCSLAPYWSARLGRSELAGYQASKRGGLVRVRDRGNRVTLSGQAVTVLRCDLLELAVQ